MALTPEQIKELQAKSQARMQQTGATSPFQAPPQDTIDKPFWEDYGLPKPTNIKAPEEPSLGTKLSKRLSDLGTGISEVVSNYSAPGKSAETLVGASKAIGGVAGGVADTIETGFNETLGRVVNPISESINTGLDKLYGYEKPTSELAGQAIEKVQQKVEEQPEVIKEPLKAAGNVVRAVGDVQGLRMGGKALSDIGQATGVNAKLGQIKTGLKQSVENPKLSAAIIDKQLKLNKVTGVKKFKDISGGKTPGEYAQERGIYGTDEEIFDGFAKDWVESYNSKKQTLKQLPNQYTYAPANEMVDELIAWESRVSRPGTKGIYSDKIKSLEEAKKTRGLTLNEMDDAKNIYENTVRLGYNKLINPDSVESATRLDKSVREFIENEASRQGFSNVKEINKRTQLSRFLAEEIEKKMAGDTANNFLSLTDYIIGAGAVVDPSALAILAGKKVLGSQRVMGGAARFFGGEGKTPTPNVTQTKAGLLEEGTPVQTQPDFYVAPEGSKAGQFESANKTIINNSMSKQGNLPEGTEIKSTSLDYSTPQKVENATKNVENLTADEAKYYERLSKQGKPEATVPFDVMQERIDELTKDIGERRLSKEFNQQALENLKDSFAGGGFDFATYAKMRNAGIRDIEALDNSELGRAGKSVLRQLEDYAGGKDIGEMMDQADNILDLIKKVKEPIGTKELISQRARLVSDEMYQEAKKNLQKNMGRINSGIPVDQIKDLTVMAAYHIENGITKVADLAVKLAEAGYDFSKAEVQKIMKAGMDFNKNVLKGAKLPVGDINELRFYKDMFDAETQKFSSPQMKKSAIEFLESKGIAIKSAKDADIVDYIDNILTSRDSLRKGLAPKPTVSKDLQPLYNEAKKYKSAEEFMTGSTELTYKNLHENPYSIRAYGKDFNEPVEYYRAGAIRKNGDIWLTDNEAGAKQYSSAGGGTKIGSYIVQSKNPLIIDTSGGKYAKGNINLDKILSKEEINKGYTNNPDIKQKFIEYAKNNGYDSVQFSDSFPDGEGGMRSLVVWDKSQIKTKPQLEQIWKEANNK